MSEVVEMGPFRSSPGYAEAVAADGNDALAGYRDRFVVADPEMIYLDGNSLGRLPQVTREHLEDVTRREWGQDLISSWGRRWWDLGLELGDQLAPLIGAAEGSIVIADSTSVNLFKLAWGALMSRQRRQRIVTDDLNFPSDLYVLAAAGTASGGRELVVVPSRDEIYGPEESLLSAIDADTALVSLSHVSFKSGYLYDMELITRAAHDAGALVLWDLSHSAGVVPIDLTDVDLAVGCTYKYLNGGPGSPAFIYVNPTLLIDNPLTGWWGHSDPFTFGVGYEPAASIARFQTGTMPVLSLTAIGPALQLIAEVGIDALRAKSVALAEHLIELVDDVLVPLGFVMASPREAARRGSHVSLRHPDAWRIAQAMIDVANVVPDFREPDNIRLGLAPLYTGFLDVHTAVHRIAALVRTGVPDRYPAERDRVT